MGKLTGKRVLIVGVETEVGRAVAGALAGAGATLALVAGRGDPESAFTVQRLARKVGAATSQAIDATNEAAVRVMVRQVAKALGGLDAVVICSEEEAVQALVRRLGLREMAPSGGGLCLVAGPDTDVVAALAALPSTG
jgi:NAD(P)-dependent dehydrogenase (short-subunit alcohol dehydrogenase family)